MRVYRTKQSKGFTLLEIIIAVAIFGVIASIIFPALMQFLDMRERVDSKHKQLSELQKTFLFLSNDLRFAANRLSKDEYGELGKTTLKLNEDGLLDFTAIYPDLSLQGNSVPRRVVWEVEDGLLIRRQYPVMDPEPDTRSTIQSLLDDVEDINIEVNHIVDGKDETDDSWREQSKLPDMIEITIELENGIEYKRAYTMQGGDANDALASVINNNASSTANRPGSSANSPSGSLGASGNNSTRPATPTRPAN